MGEYSELLPILALTLGVAWASGLNLYAVIAILGLGSATGYVALPTTLAVLADPLVIFAACVMYCIEFMADKTPGVDTAWDAVHTFVRIPGGALLAAGAVGDVQPAMVVATGLLGGGIAAVTHASKAGARVIIDASPEPYSNWGASLGEDILVIVGLWTALAHPLVFLLAFALLAIGMIWLLPRLAVGIRSVAQRLKRWLGLATPAIPEQSPP